MPNKIQALYTKFNKHSDQLSHTYLVLMAWSLTVLSQSDQCLCYQLHVVGMDVETEQDEATSSDTTDTVQELESFKDEVVAGLTVLLFAEVVL